MSDACVYSGGLYIRCGIDTVQLSASGDAEPGIHATIVRRRLHSRLDLHAVACGMVWQEECNPFNRAGQSWMREDGFAFNALAVAAETADGQSNMWYESSLA